MIESGSKTYAFGKCLVTVATGRAFFQIYITGRCLQSSGEIALFPTDSRHRGHCCKLNVLLPAALGKIGCQSAKVTVIGGKSPVKLGHQTADVKGGIDQDDVLFSLCQIERGANTAKTAAYNKYLVADWKCVCILHFYLFIH